MEKVDGKRYRYYVVYNFYKNNGGGGGCLSHERGDKLTDIEKIKSLQATILRDTQETDPSINQILIVNFILMDEFEEVDIAGLSERRYRKGDF